MAKLNKTDIDRLVGKPQKRQLEFADGNNLYLFVTKIGSCKFKYRIRNEHKATWLVIGKYPDITLNEARQKALDIRRMIANGIDPVIAKSIEQSKLITVATLANRYLTEQMPLVRTKENSKKQFIRTVNKNIVSIIGNTFIHHVTDEVIRNKLIYPKIENGSPSVARQVRNAVKAIFDFAIELGLIESNPTERIKTSKIYRDKPRKRHLTFDEIKIFLNLLYQAPIKTQTKFALHLSLMLLTRKSELTNSTWDQVDFKQHTFTIIESKMDTQLVIPLPNQAIALFKKLKELAQGSSYIFIGRSGIHTPISSTTLNWALKPINQFMFHDNKENYFTVHDLRRTGATLLGEMGYPSDYIEIALNHSKSGMKQVYQRSRFIEQRKEMLQKWADELDKQIEPQFAPYDKHFII